MQPSEPRADVFEAFMGREVVLKVEARGSRIETVKSRLDGTSTRYGVSYFVLENGRRLVRANCVVDMRLAEDVAAEKAAEETVGP